MSQLVIASVEAIPIRSEPSRPRRSALGQSMGFDYGLVLVRTACGIEGLGEISMLWDGMGGRACYEVNHILAPTILGLSAFDIPRALARMEEVIRFSRGSNTAKAAIEMALWDIQGKHLDTPVFNLLGGRMRDSVPLSISIYMDDPEAMAESAAAMVAKGFRTIKIKVGQGRDRDRAALAAIRAAIGDDIAIRVDANMAWRSPAVAAASIRALEEFGIHSVEQPMAPERLADMALLRSQVSTPIMLDESIWSPEDAALALRAGAADILNVYVSESGGIYNAGTIFRMARAFGTDATIGSMPELGIGTAAQIHLGLSVQDFDCPGDVCGALYHARDIIRETIPVRNGHVHALTGPGLGVTLDPDALRDMRRDASE
ncbi:mandelate racemase/muconate lactonizing enzyme family protein [Chelatococcus asaccharovorans]|uniref:Muconate cycloisomerase n=1 Tax=Chelatococcus asaccharovorans TaxID=28210 RepID=A0A2V3UL93_9HYPH|nr:enolase C-terminal domain-like protein [Chelatococcus asaccharovorans]MBS7706268.1 hypothetical protein [Chelatococcus asaccharovorans]PXW65094.1 muconate cycloisomerase [Chelatococcus asaccharovorans]